MIKDAEEAGKITAGKVGHHPHGIQDARKCYSTLSSSARALYDTAQHQGKHRQGLSKQATQSCSTAQQQPHMAAQALT